ncbi:unnamed protein product [Paramecium sonneborni]|uniref:Uncharacterized protein n=1 Tax=Paramecium sonneborni TaxID=65129 RepID=A0A8S1PUN4_9CILI|nr:unnamed protein product [Paramecium sonneborni]
MNQILQPQLQINFKDSESKQKKKKLFITKSVLEIQKNDSVAIRVSRFVQKSMLPNFNTGGSSPCWVLLPTLFLSWLGDLKSNLFFLFFPSHLKSCEKSLNQIIKNPQTFNLTTKKGNFYIRKQEEEKLQEQKKHLIRNKTERMQNLYVNNIVYKKKRRYSFVYEDYNSNLTIKAYMEWYFFKQIVVDFEKFHMWVQRENQKEQIVKMYITRCIYICWGCEITNFGQHQQPKRWFKYIFMKLCNP